MQFAALCFALICFDGGGAISRYVARDHVSRIELNHVLGADGSVTLDQVIYWDFSPTHGFLVRAWRSHKCFSQTPYRSPGGMYEAFFHDSRDGNVAREVTADSFVETWTDYDPECVNQEVLDRNCRRELTRPDAGRGRK